MKAPQLTALAEAMEKAAEGFAEAAAAFREALDGAEDGGGNGKAGKAGRGAAKPAPAKGKAAEADDVTIDEVREALQALLAAKGKDKMVEALESVGAGKLADVDESQYAELKATAETMTEAEDEAPAKPAKGKGKKAKGPTVEEVTEAFKALLEADRAKAKAVLKELGVAKLGELEEEQYAEALTAITAAAEEEDSLL